ncbi:MAG: hypothetical protein QM733_08630 [Ilumatobacteraceae bacterium]
MDVGRRRVRRPDPRLWSLVRPPLQYFRLTLLAPDYELYDVIPVPGETVEPGVAPTRPRPSMPPSPTLVSPDQVAAAEAALRADQSILDLIGTDFTIIRATAGRAAEGQEHGVSFELKLGEPRPSPAGVPAVGGGDERTPGTLGPSSRSWGPVRYIGVVLRADNTLWWYWPIPDELGEHHEHEAAGG